MHPDAYHLLNEQPLPLYDTQKKIAILHSAKSGSLLTLEWFLAQTGQLEYAQSRHKWLHNYRTKELDVDPKYKENFHSIIDDAYTIIRVVRNPFARTVSAFLHCMQRMHRKPQLLPPVLQEKHNSTLSFREFVHGLQTVDITNTESHYRLQAKRIEYKGVLSPTYIVTLENAYSDFRHVETILQLPHVELSHASKSDHRHTYIPELRLFWGDKQLNRHSPNVFPQYPYFYDAELEEIVTGLYAEDFSRYNYATMLPPVSLATLC